MLTALGCCRGGREQGPGSLTEDPVEGSELQLSFVKALEI